MIVKSEKDEIELRDVVADITVKTLIIIERQSTDPLIKKLASDALDEVTAF